MDHSFSPDFPQENRAWNPTLRLEGELDLAVAPRLHSELETLFEAGAASIVVDLLDATFLDSTALGVLVSALNRCQEMGGQLHLIVTAPQILRVLSITGLTDIFSLHESRDGVAPLNGKGNCDRGR